MSDEINTFETIKNIYFTIDKNFDILLAVCKNDEEKKKLKLDYAIARANYRKSLNLNFENSDPTINELSKELESLYKRIEKDIENTSSVLNVLKMISESVKIASSIVVLVLTLV